MAEDEIEYEGLSSDAGLMVCLNEMLLLKGQPKGSFFLLGQHGCRCSRESQQNIFQAQICTKLSVVGRYNRTRCDVTR